MVEQIPNVLPAENVLRERVSVRPVPRLLLELAHRVQAGPGSGLVGRHHGPFDPEGLVEGPDRNRHQDGRAVRVGEDAPVAGHGVPVDLGHDQRHVRVHAKGGRVVDDDAARRRRLGGPLLGEVAARREQDDVEVVEGVRVDGLAAVGAARELDGVAGLVGVGEQPQVGDGKPALLELVAHLDAHGARRAGDAHVGPREAVLLPRHGAAPEQQVGRAVGAARGGDPAAAAPGGGERAPRERAGQARAERERHFFLTSLFSQTN